MAFNLCNQIHLPSSLCNGVEVGVSQFVQLTKQSVFVEFVQFQYMFLLTNKMTLVAQMLRIQLHIILSKQVSGVLQELGKIVYSGNFLIRKTEECFPFGSTQQFHSLDIVGTHVAHSGTVTSALLLAQLK
jgi:hypothetical protein